MHSIGAHIYKFPEREYEDKEGDDYQIFDALCRKYVVVCEKLFQIKPPLSFFQNQCSSIAFAHAGAALSTGILFTIHLKAHTSVRIIEAVTTNSIGAGQYF